jgi:hypothetical protein
LNFKDMNTLVRVERDMLHTGWRKKMKESCDFYKNEKAIARGVKYCRKLSSKILGLMFVSAPGNGAFLPDVKDIHMNFRKIRIKGRMA